MTGKEKMAETREKNTKETDDRIVAEVNKWVDDNETLITAYGIAEEMNISQNYAIRAMARLDEEGRIKKDGNADGFPTYTKA